ncbi:MMPL family transporter [Actinocrispum wychmicini]|uniref:RND superfamily putative drug exporter n=1 Tax=Actinocrispum wychmicini TaxID=1213861 RepID=A0A4R2JXT7_9PSEU|nr:MMPL family transporter [Actinocrispum wychmicini]TCO62238.1 RND superfamily putative drug exporter [Actinocrispum wychmicini]
MTQLVSPAPERSKPGRSGGGLQRVLQRVAEGIVRRHKLVIVAWLVVIAASTPFAFQLSSVLTKQGASKVVPGTSSADVERLVEQDFPQRSQRETLLVLTAPDVREPRVRQFLAAVDAGLSERVARGEIDQTVSAYTIYRDAATAYLTQLQGPDGIRTAAADLALRTDWAKFPVPVPPEVVSTVISSSGGTTLVSVSFSKKAGNDPDVDGLRALAARSLHDAGLDGVAQVHATGELALIHDTYAKADADNGTMETAAYVIILLVLLLFFRAVVPAVVTLVSIGLAMNVSQAALFGLGHAVTLTQFTVTIMTFVMLGAGVDYSMLLSSRYRQERLAGRSVREAVVHATTHAGESVMLAGGAVALSFGATLLSPVDWIPPLGYGGLLGIPIILLAALTLTPALLTLFGDKFFLLGRKPLADMESTGLLSRYLRRVSAVASRRKIAVTLLFLLVTVPFGFVVASNHSTADPVALSPDTDSKRGFELVAKEWGHGTVFPTVIAGPIAAGAADGTKLTDSGYQAVTDLGDRLAGVPGVSEVDTVARPFGKALPRAEVTDLPPDVRKDFLADNGTLRIVVKLKDEPYSAAASDTVKRVETVLSDAGKAVGNLELGGATRVDEQYGSALNSSFWQMVLLVSLGVFLMLLLTIRSLVIPLHLIGTIMMSNVWAIGVTVLLFRDVFGLPVIDDLPIFLIILMMGLGMDYEIFLVTRVRDLVRGGMANGPATMRAVVDTGRVITSAGLVMAGSLGTMVLSSTIMLQQYGTGLATAVLLDATLVRMLFVPATLLLFGKYNWWLPKLRRAAR